MKTKAAKKQGWSKQKKQFVALGALTLVLLVVLALQFRDSEADYPVAALAEDAAVTATAEPQAEQVAEEPAPEAQDNPVLSQAPEDPKLPRNPFTSFWSRDTDASSAPTSFPPPNVVLGMTIPNGERPVAVIDGELRFVGDQVGGWILEEVHARAVVLRSPGQEQLVVEMPLYRFERVMPSAVAPAGSAR